MTTATLPIADPKTLSPKEIDRILSESYRKTFDLDLAIDRNIGSLRKLRAGSGYAYLSPEKREARIETLEKENEGHREAIAVETASASPFQAIYNEKRWNRYFLVMGGHVHRGMRCSSCYPTTQYSWLISLADCDETAMVEEYGERACTVCFPNAPTMPAFLRSVANREAEEEAKADAKCPGSGKYVRRSEDRRFYCPDCHIWIRPTRNQNVRTHDKPRE